MAPHGTDTRQAIRRSFGQSEPSPAFGRQLLAHRNCPLDTMLQIGREPVTAGTVAALYGDGELPPALVELLQASVWCERVGAYVPIEERGRVVVTPRRG